MHRPPSPRHPRLAPRLALLLVVLALPAVAPQQDGGVAVAVVGAGATPGSPTDAGPDAGLDGDLEGVLDGVLDGPDGPGCKRGDRFFRPGSTWQEDDGCLSCSCDRGGHARCQAFMCQVSCDNPRRVQGECCPACDGQSVVTQSQSCPSLGNCTLKCTHGFVLDDLGCYSCLCQQGAACTLECPGGYARDAAGNELCQCACPAAETCTKRCTHGYRKDQNGCSQCACLPGRNTSQPVVGEGAPSKTCSDAVRERDDGEYWWDGCRGCYCAAGVTLCELASCKDIHSALRRMADHALCDPATGLASGLAAGCATCRCVHGRALCEVAACPPAACPHPLPPDPMGCCPTCSDSWLREPGVPEYLSGAGRCAGGHEHGTSWRETDCRSCRCRAAKTECFEQRCAALQCDLQFTPRGMCCPVCLGEGSKKPPPPKPAAGGPGALDGVPGAVGTCWWRNRPLSPADEWFPDECTHCLCDPAGSGSSTCTQVVCPACSSQPGRADSRTPYCCPPCADGAGGVPLLVSLLVAVLLLVLVILVLGYFVWQRGRRQTLEIARADAARPARPVATYTYNMIPPLSR